MKFLLYSNPTSSLAVATAGKIASLLKKRGHVCFRPGQEGDAPDMMIVVGGDGTVLRAVREYPGGRVPIWAVNAGHVGFLTSTSAECAEAETDLILRGDYTVERRMILEGVHSSAAGNTSFFCLNEMAVHRSACLHSVRISLSVDRKDLLSFSGDGVLIATPTGSTAYNLSLGGPILLPASEDMVITPICPHSAMGVPLVVKGSSSIFIRIERNGDGSDDGDAHPRLEIDGAVGLTLLPGDTVSATRGAWTAGFVRTREDTFYRRLRIRMIGADA